MASKLTFIRHGHTVWNGPPKRFQGHNDVPLSETGFNQCKARQGEFDWVKRVVSSPALRVRQTVDTLFEDAKSSPPITHNANLWEIDNGYYGGKLIEEVKAQHPENYDEWMTRPGEARPGGGETLLILLTRAVLAIREIRKSPIEGTLVATHGGIIRVLTLATQNRSLNDFHKLTVDNLQIFTLNTEQLDALEFLDMPL